LYWDDEWKISTGNWTTADAIIRRSVIHEHDVPNGPRQEFLGMVEHTEDAFPNLMGGFHPEEALEAVRHLFEAEIACVSAGD